MGKGRYARIELKILKTQRKSCVVTECQIYSLDNFEMLTISKGHTLIKEKRMNIFYTGHCLSLTSWLRNFVLDLYTSIPIFNRHSMSMYYRADRGQEAKTWSGQEFYIEVFNDRDL